MAENSKKEEQVRVSHFIPIDFNHDSICGLPKTEWQSGTNNWDWVNCPICLEHRSTTGDAE